MICVKSEFVALVKNEWSHVTSSHCLLHRYTTDYSIEDSNSTFDGRYGRCDQSYQFHLFEGKNSPALPTFSQRNGTATCETFVLCQSPQEANASLGCMSLKIRLKSFF